MRFFKFSQLRILTFWISVEIALWVFAAIGIFNAFIGATITTAFRLWLLNSVFSVFAIIIGIFLINFILNILGQIIDTLRDLSSRNSASPLSLENYARIESLIESINSKAGTKIDNKSIVIVKRIHRIEAMLKGVFFPKILISGGMFVGLSRDNPDAKSMFAHEVSHIISKDKYVIGFIFLATLSILGNLYYFTTDQGSLYPINYLFHATITALVVRDVVLMREYNADFISAYIIGSKREIIDLIVKSKDSKSIWHPSKEKRICALENKSPVQKIRIYWILNWIIYILFPIGTFIYFYHYVYMPNIGAELASAALQIQTNILIGDCAIGVCGIIFELKRTYAARRITS